MYEEEKLSKFINYEKWMKKQQKLDIEKRFKIASIEKNDAIGEESNRETGSQQTYALLKHHRPRQLPHSHPNKQNHETEEFKNSSNNSKT